MNVFSIDLLISPLARCYQILFVRTRRNTVAVTKDGEAEVMNTSFNDMKKVLTFHI